MISPLVDSLSDLTEHQLEEKVRDLQRKYFQSNNTSIKHQITIYLDIYQAEIANRREIAAQKQREQIEKNGDNDVDSLINIS